MQQLLNRAESRFESEHTQGGKASLSSQPEDSFTKAFQDVDEEDLSDNLDFFRNLKIIPTQKISTRAHPLGAGMEAMYEALVAGYSSLSEILGDSPDLTVWVAKATSAFLKEFHIRWPVLHAPTFDSEEDPLPLAVTVCMIGSWLQSPSSSADRFHALKTHDFLLQRFLQDIVRARSTAIQQ